MKILVVIPAFNEEESLERTVSTLCEAVPECDFIVVNDGSKDLTADVCRENEYPFIDLPINLGLTGAFQAGVKYAYKHGYDCVVQFDADGQHRAEYIEALARETAKNDIVVGSRFVDKKKPLTLRMLGSNVIQLAIELTTGQRIADPTSGMRAFGKKAIRALALGSDFGPEPDTVSWLIKKTNASVVEVPVIMDDRIAGESYLTLGRSVRYMTRMVVSILFIQLFR